MGTEDKYLLIIFLLLGIVVTLTATEKRANSVAVYEKNCLLEVIKFLNPLDCIDVEGDTVKHLGSCLVDGKSYSGNVEIWTCVHGHWKGTSGSLADVHHRQKRFFELFAGLFIVGCLLFCGGGGGGGGGGGTQIVTKYPPSFSDPCKPADVLDNYNVAAGETSVVVSWTIAPVATDRDGGTPSVTQVGGGVNGSRFVGATYGKTHYITYKATDDDGLTGHCYFSFTVTTLACDTLPWPANGARSCENNNILGSSCQYTCNPGYQLTGSDTVTCQDEVAPTWSLAPTCEKKSCSPPSYPDHSTVQCTDPAYAFQSVCSIFCDNGFSLEGHFYMQCQADGTWSNAGSSSCKDGTPPTIACVTPQIFHADRGITSTSVNWQVPTATDRTDANPSIVQTGGPTAGAILEVGSDIVTYKAVDVDGNESPECFIELRVEEITCGHPLDSFEDNYLVFNCSTSRYIYGTSCTLSCTAHLPLEGTDLVTCEKNGQSEGVWSWGTGDKPYCRAIACPDLDPPINGALVYDTIQTRPVYTMMCNDKFDIPDMGTNFNGMLFCTDDGDWTPIDPVPDCIEPRNPRFLNLPAEIFYYGGDCGSEAAMAEIEQNFIDILESELNPYFETICPSGETCTTGSITITCGPISGRKKRSLSWEYNNEGIRVHKNNNEERTREHIIQKRSTHTHLLILEFYIVMELKLDNTSVQDAILVYDDVQLNILKPAVQGMINNGTFDLQGFVLESDSFQTANYGDITCDPGYMLDRTTCKPCPLGYFVNETSCDLCPVGQYKENESDASCTSCPAGYSTKTTGSKSLADCNKQCSPGSYSPNTVESCSTCRHGYYQDEYGQTSCKTCPSGTTTESTNSTSVNECKNYDVLIETTNGGVTVSTFPGTLSDISFMFWSKCFDEQSSNAVLRLTNGGAALINVYLTENIRVEIPSQIDETVGSHSSSSWNHVTITWDTANSNVTVYLGGESVYSTNTVSAPSTPLLDNGAFVVTSTGQTGVYLTGMHLLGNVLTQTDIANHASSCHITENDDVINIGVFDNFSEQGISLIAASSCYATDACLSSPCNGHICTNGQDSFTCTCQSGWSGTTCTVQPDFCIDNDCKNNATCFSGDTNYTCICLPGYSGTFCEVSPVDGGWSDWKVSECSKSCGSGTMNRTRQCDSPPPDTYGADCIGDQMETTPCNVEECPVCKEFEIRYGTLLNCTTNQITGSESCVLYCENGKLLPPGLTTFQTYTCGPDTNYVWDSLDNPPSCVDPVGPDNVNITVNVDYTSAIPDNAISSVEDVIGSQISSVACYNSPNCQTTVEIEQSSMILTFNIPLHLGPDIQYENYISTGTANDALQELIDAITYLESTAQHIKNHTNGIFDVNVDGLTYTSDVNSLTFGPGVTCNSGFVALDGVCVRCPSGTYSANGVCNFCEKGTYRSNTGQISCLQCLNGLTTSTIGSSDISQCTETTATSTSEKPGDKHDDQDKSTVYVAIVISMVALLVALAALAVVWYKIFRPKSRVNGSDTNLRMEPAHSRCSRVYTRTPDTRIPRSITSLSNGNDDDFMRGSDVCHTPDVRLYQVRMPSAHSGYLTPTEVHVECNSPPPPYDPPALPEYSEKDETPYDTIN
ncbi:sushi, von Willebrand factor type A, EGF and pentraxin domain-containing protein 1-like isoform X2 [Mercenaria mercenaria]|uniref:sushi, von Willebrand factor type A, EGF and pentraxin domain-containing protein 1-like isoform X2 n=1 Tax=Mercenaria mercenaria TaxID=6596 RepID=UPI00234F015A|nr:sushi, von Willebrand factor type A, EGF and pentraxin domain-containing protein 1-like isoform X2 [Mercenaria mercenaria]